VRFFSCAVLPIIVILCRPAMPAFASETSKSQKWLTALTETLSSSIELDFRRNLPEVDTNSYRLSAQVTALSWTSEDWFHAVLIGAGREKFLVGNSLAPHARPSNTWPFFADFRWAIGYDSTHFWFVQNGTNLLVAHPGEGVRFGVPQLGLPPPQHFALGLWSVVHEVLTLGLNDIDPATFQWTAERFVAADNQGQRMSGHVEIVSANMERIRYGRNGGVTQVVELDFDDSLLRSIRCLSARDGRFDLRVYYDNLRFTRLAAEPDLSAPPIMEYVRRGTVILYTNKSAVQLALSSKGQIQKFRVADSGQKDAARHRGVKNVLRGMMLLIVLVPIMYFGWMYLREKRRASDDGNHG
jgi:hypothetical protein